MAAGVYTTNLVFAAPVKWDRSLTPGSNIRGVVINSGNANACTGNRGDADCRHMAELAGAVCDAQAEQMLVLSTGIIGEFLPTAKIEKGIRDVAGKLGTNEASLTAAHAKAHTSEIGRFVARTATEVHGGMGFTDLLGLHYWFKRIGLNRQLLGGPERVRHLAAQMQGFAA